METADQKAFQIRLSLKGNPPKLKSVQSAKPNHVVTVAPLMTMEELLDLAYQLFGVPKGGKTYEIELWQGFPPRKIDLDDAGSRRSLVTANGIQGGEAVTVKIEKIKPKSTAATKTTQSRKRPLPVAASNGGSEENAGDDAQVTGRPKRASAKAATESFKDVIRAQDKMVRDEKKKGTTAAAKKAKPPTAAQSAARKNLAEARVASANSRRLVALPGGRRLNDDAPPPASPSPEKQSRSKKATSSIFSGLNSEEDISFALISSIDSGSKRNGKVSKVLRGAMRKTVEKSYEASRAVVRSSAITSGKVTFTRCEAQGENTNNSMGTFTVRYPKGVEGIGFYEEQVHIITPLMLKAVIQAVYEDHDEENGDDNASGREMLKPPNMALLSSRVFWSLWFHHHDQCSTIEEALTSILPDLDWAFLYQRSRQLSEKAKENLRQVTKVKDTSKEEKQDHEAGIRAVQAVEKAMETMYDETVVNARDRAADAALARFDKGTGTDGSSDKWSLVTPMEVDEDELRECINECQDGICLEVVEQCIQTLISKLSINNWRVLANASSSDVHRLFKEDGIEVNLETTETWISAAQTRSIEEIMLEILDSNQDLFAILCEELSSGTPKDLSLWAAVPSLLIEEANSELNVAEGDVRKYCERATTAIETLEWLQFYTTSICNST